MTAYYNEFDPYAAEWLRNLIDAKLIAPGDVDERSIKDVKADDLKGYSQAHFFAGIGGWSYALRLAGWPDTRPVWTGSCPCQPFSAAGKQKGFADDRHLWPAFRSLIEVGRPAIVFGEQVVSATAWLGLVRGDLEALDYAVGAMPIQAASAGADHLRDRYWFVGHDTRLGRGEGRPEHEVRSGRDATASAGGVGLADAHKPGSQGRELLSECADERIARSNGVAHADFAGSREGREQRGGQFGGPGGDPQTCHVGDRSGERFYGRQNPAGETGRLGAENASFEWVIGADGKARRVKPGVRLLAHGIPNRVGKLRGFGNAIDPRPAAAFISAAIESLGGDVVR